MPWLRDLTERLGRALRGDAPVPHPPRLPGRGWPGLAYPDPRAFAGQDLYDVAYRWGWETPELRELVALCYKTPDFSGNARRFRESSEFRAALAELSALGHPPPRRLLDFACGNGVASWALAREGYDVVGVDSSRGDVAGLGAARHLAGLDGVTFELQHAQEPRLAFPDRSFDVVWIREALHHMPAPGPFLRDVRRVLRPGGVVACLRDVVIWSESQRADFFDRHPFYHITGDEGCFYLDEYLQGFAEAGLELVRVIDPVGSAINTWPEPWREGAKWDREAARARAGGYDLFSFFARRTA